MTLQDLQSQQTNAATAYNAALQAFYAAWIGLASVDGAIASAQAGGGPLRSFGGNLDDIRAPVLHCHPLVPPPGGVPISSQVAAARDALISELA